MHNESMTPQGMMCAIAKTRVPRAHHALCYPCIWDVARLLKVLQHLACMDDAILYGKPFGINALCAQTCLAAILMAE
jgi:hypothetical protein